MEGLEKHCSCHTHVNETIWMYDAHKISQEHQHWLFDSIWHSRNARAQNIFRDSLQFHLVSSARIYSSYHTVGEDQLLCARNFLHRYSLTFDTARGGERPTTVRMPCPGDQLTSLKQAGNGMSYICLNKWLLMRHMPNTHGLGSIELRLSSIAKDDQAVLMHKPSIKRLICRMHCSSVWQGLSSVCEKHQHAMRGGFWAPASPGGISLKNCTLPRWNEPDQWRQEWSSHILGTSDTQWSNAMQPSFSDANSKHRESQSSRLSSSGLPWMRGLPAWLSEGWLARAMGWSSMILDATGETGQDFNSSWCMELKNCQTCHIGS